MTVIFQQIPLWSKKDPKCEKCKFYRKTSINPRLNECAKFRQTENNQVIFLFAVIARSYSDFCGPNGLFFECSDEFPIFDILEF